MPCRREDFTCPRLTLNWLCSQARPPTPDPPACTSLVLGLHTWPSHTVCAVLGVKPRVFLSSVSQNHWHSARTCKCAALRTSALDRGLQRSHLLGPHPCGHSASVLQSGCCPETVLLHWDRLPHWAKLGKQSPHLPSKEVTHPIGSSLENPRWAGAGLVGRVFLQHSQSPGFDPPLSHM